MILPVDLRSDTVTKPTPAMREAMASAVLGDDVLGDDPTVAELEKLGAEITGFESAVFVPSGTMANQIAVATHCNRGDSVLLDEEAHIFFYEVGAPAVIGQVVTATLPHQNGVIAPEVLRSRVLMGSLHTPGTSLICIENTHNRSGGQVVPVAILDHYRSIAAEAKVLMHLDGARIFNASTWLGVDVRELTKQFDSASICLSKGLSAPVGSLLLGNADFIDRARFWRKRLGGGMRQSGLLAACGIISLNEVRFQLGDDHLRAQRIAEGLKGIEGCTISHCTNFVMVETQAPASLWCALLEEKNVRALPAAPNRVRLVTHRDISDDMVARAIEAFTLCSTASQIQQHLPPR